jgi:hypothetical protein
VKSLSADVWMLIKVWVSLKCSPNLDRLSLICNLEFLTQNPPNSIAGTTGFHAWLKPLALNVLVNINKTNCWTMRTLTARCNTKLKIIISMENFRLTNLKAREKVFLTMYLLIWRTCLRNVWKFCSFLGTSSQLLHLTPLLYLYQGVRYFLQTCMTEIM